MIRCGVQEEFSEDIGSAYLLCSCQISATDFMVSSIQQTYYFSHSKIKHTFPICYTSICYVPENDLIIGATSGNPSLQIFTSSCPTQFLLKEFVLHQSIINQIYCSISSNILITVGNKEIKVWDIEPVKKIQLTFNLTNRATFPSSPLCSNGMNLISVDLKRHRIFVPHIQGFILYSFDGAVLEKQIKFTNFISTAVSVLPSPRKYPGLDLSYQSFLYIFKKLAIVESNGLMRIFHKSGKYLLTLNPLASASILFVAFINSEFLITVNTDGDIFLNDIKTSKIKLIYQTGQRPDKVDLFEKPEPRLSIISGRHLRIFRISTIWKLFYRPVESVTSIDRFCSSMYSARIGLLSSDGCIFMISNPKTLKNKQNNKSTLLSDNYRKRYLVGTASSRSCSRPITYAYNRDFNENSILISMDDSSVCLFDYIKDDWKLKQLLPFKARLVLIVVGTQFLNWIVCCCGFYGDVVFYKFGTWTLITRLSVGLKQCDYAFWSKKDDILIVLSEDRLNIIELKRFYLIKWYPFKTPKHASFEEGEMIASYEKGVLYRCSITPSGIDRTNRCGFGNDIVNVSLKYGCHIVVLNNNSIVIGDNQNMSTSIIELPFPIFSANFLSPDLDLLVALDHEIMIIEKKIACPSLHPLNVSPDDFDNSKTEPLFNFPMIDKLNNEVILNNKRRMKKKPIQRSSNYEPVEVVIKRIREKIREEEENEFQYIQPEGGFYTPVLSWNLPKRKKIVSFASDFNFITEKTITFKKIERKPVNLILNKRLNEILFNPLAYDENGNKVFNYSKNYEGLRFVVKNFLKIDVIFCLNIAEIPSIVAETDEELDQIYNSKKNNPEEYERKQFNSIKSNLTHSKSSNCIYKTFLQKPKLRRSLSIENLSNRHRSDQNEVAYCDEDDFLFQSLCLLKKHAINSNFNSIINIDSSKNNLPNSSLNENNSRNAYGNASSQINGRTNSMNAKNQSSLSKSNDSQINNDKLKHHKKQTSSTNQESGEEDYDDIMEIQNDYEYDDYAYSQTSYDSTSQCEKKKKKKNDSPKNKKLSNNKKDKQNSSFLLNDKLTNENQSKFTNQNSNKDNHSLLNQQSNEDNHSLLNQQSNEDNHSLLNQQSNEANAKNHLSLFDHDNKMVNPLNQYEYDEKQGLSDTTNLNAKKVKGKQGKKQKGKTRKTFKSSRDQKSNTDKKSDSNFTNNANSNLIDEGSQFIPSEFRINKNNEEQTGTSKQDKLNHLNKQHEMNSSNLPVIDQISDNNEQTFQIKEPEFDNLSYRRPSSSRRKRNNSPIDQNDLSQSRQMSFELYNRKEIDEEEEIEESKPPERHGRQLLINKDALTLYNPMDVPRIYIRYGSANKNNTEKPPIRIHKGTEKRKVIIRRQQLSNETNSINRNFFNF